MVGSMIVAGVWTGVGFSNLKNCRTRAWIKKFWKMSGVGVWKNDSGHQRCTQSEIFDSDSTPASTEYTPTHFKVLDSDSCSNSKVNYPILCHCLNQWFWNFFWSRTICVSRTVITYHIVPGKVNVPNIIRSKVWKSRIDTYATWTEWLWEILMAIFRKQQGK